jgi:four helix bundle protein
MEKGRMRRKSEGENTGLAGFAAHRKALELFDKVVEDVQTLHGRYELSRLLSQQLASADSIAANIEEGYGRGSSKEYVQFLVIARGSTQETKGRYARLLHWLPEESTRSRIALCDEILSILTATIKTLRARTAEPRSKPSPLSLSPLTP